jgi:hypothetical protein
MKPLQFGDDVEVFGMSGLVAGMTLCMGRNYDEQMFIIELDQCINAEGKDCPLTLKHLVVIRENIGLKE